jgi:hypothetical protein
MAKETRSIVDLKIFLSLRNSIQIWMSNHRVLVSREYFQVVRLSSMEIAMHSRNRDVPNTNRRTADMLEMPFRTEDTRQWLAQKPSMATALSAVHNRRFGCS